MALTVGLVFRVQVLEFTGDLAISAGNPVVMPGVAYCRALGLGFRILSTCSQTRICGSYHLGVRGLHRVTEQNERWVLCLGLGTGQECPLFQKP